ncbi:hypothetical protein AB0I84_02065 [Streptomyces spectabilis]|uniref:hypothetical protein n=1 Tax=Streptomyces spectabilis TaxID=68270 RepID=UPI0033ECB558
MSVKRALIAGAGAAILAVGLSGYAASAEPDGPNAKVVDVVNESLDGAFDRIGGLVWEECGKGHPACAAILDEVNGMGLNYGGEDYPVMFYEDGSWIIGDMDNLCAKGDAGRVHCSDR